MTDTIAPDGYAVLLDDTSSPRGFWFAYAYLDQATAAKSAAVTKGRVVPIYFARELERLQRQLAKVDAALDEAGAPKSADWEGLNVALSRRGRIRRLAK